MSVLPQSRPDRVKKLFEELSPKTRMALALQTFKEQQEKQGLTSPRFSHATGGHSVSVTINAEKTQSQHQMSVESVIETQNDLDMSNTKSKKYLQSYRKIHGNRSIQPYAEAAVLKNSKLVEEFFETKSYEFEVTEKDDDDNKIVSNVMKTGVICNDVEGLTKFVVDKRDNSSQFNDKLKIQADGGQNSMKISVNIQKSSQIIENISESVISQNEQIQNNDSDEVPEVLRRSS